MTERDKKLLVFLGLFLVVVGLGWFVIRPLTKDITEVKAAIETESAVKIEMEDKIAMLPSRKAFRNSVQKELESEASELYPIMQSQLIDKLLTNMSVGMGADARKLSISAANEYYITSPYYLSSLAQSQPEPFQTSGIYAASVELELGGSRGELQKILDSFYEDYPSIRIASYRWTNYSARYAGYSWIINIKMEVFMFELND